MGGSRGETGGQDHLPGKSRVAIGSLRITGTDTLEKQLNPLDPIASGGRSVRFSVKYFEILNKTESAVFLYCRFSLFLKDPFFPD